MPSDSTEHTAIEILKRDPELKPHLEALGLASIEEYTSWCARNGFSVRVHKHWHDRCKERYFASRGIIQERLAHQKNERRKPRRTIERIIDGDLDESSLTQPHLLLVHRAAATTNDEQVRRAFRQLVLHAEGQTALLTTQPACPQFGTQAGNTFIDGLLALSQSHSHWIRPLRTWKPRTHNVRRQFSSLAGHLLARFPVPSFMDSVWFRGQPDDAAKQQGWYRAIAVGQSPRGLDFPIALTKRMAHHFLKAPKDFSVHAALRFGQVLGLGGNERLVHVLIGSRIGTSFENNDFWATVIRWFVDNPMFDPAQVGPLID